MLRLLSRNWCKHVKTASSTQIDRLALPSLIRNRAYHQHRVSHTALPPHYEPHIDDTGVRGMLSVNKLKKLVADEKIDTVIVNFPDIYGRLMGKRCDAEFFLDSVLKGGTHACNYLLACDMHMNPIPGFKFANWEKGFGDVHVVPDLSSLRICSWHEKTVMVICDVKDDKTHDFVKFAPRSILRRQIDTAHQKFRSTVRAASELEYYLYKTSFRHAAEIEYSSKHIQSVSDVVEDYHTLQSSREEKYNGAFRRHMRESGIPVENTKGEAGIGQHELNVKFADILPMADRHSVYKMCVKEVADQMGVSATFMSKPFTDATGSGCHIHLSLHNEAGDNLFPGTENFHNIQCSTVFKQFLAGWLKYTPDFMVFYAPTINSYKRFVFSSWAPTRLAWSYDNRTAGFRVVGHGKSLRIECRIPGADVNPYLAFAGSLASGLQGIQEKLEPPALFEGNIYEAQQIPQVPKTLRDSIDIFEKSSVAKETLGDEVVEHYVNFYRSEVSAFDKAVTDWERKRYFEQI